MNKNKPISTSLSLLMYLDYKSNNLGTGNLNDLRNKISFLNMPCFSRKERVIVPVEELSKEINRYVFRSNKGILRESFSGILVNISSFNGPYKHLARVLFKDYNSFEADKIAYYNFYARLNKDVVYFDNLCLYFS